MAFEAFPGHRIGLEGDDAALGSGPVAELQDVTPDIGADIEAGGAATNQRPKVAGHHRLVAAGNAVAEAWIDAAGGIVEGPAEPGSTPGHVQRAFERGSQGGA